MNKGESRQIMMRQIGNQIKCLLERCRSSQAMDSWDYHAKLWREQARLFGGRAHRVTGIRLGEFLPIELFHSREQASGQTCLLADLLTYLPVEPQERKGPVFAHYQACCVAQLWYTVVW
jgi:hypothetical protein